MSQCRGSALQPTAAVVGCWWSGCASLGTSDSGTSSPALPRASEPRGRDPGFRGSQSRVNPNEPGATSQLIDAIGRCPSPKARHAPGVQDLEMRRHASIAICRWQDPERKARERVSPRRSEQRTRHRSSSAIGRTLKTKAGRLLERLLGDAASEKPSWAGVRSSAVG